MLFGEYDLSEEMKKVQSEIDNVAKEETKTPPGKPTGKIHKDKYEVFLDDENKEFYLDNNGTKRDLNGRLMKGHKQLPSINPKTSIVRNKAELRDYLSLRLGPGGHRMMDVLIRMATYNVEYERELHEKKYKDNPAAPKFVPLYKPFEVIMAAKFIAPYYVGLASINIEKTENITIEHKVSDIAKLVQENRSKLKLIDNTKEDVIDINTDEAINE
jgi:hypothetical protein